MRLPSGENAIVDVRKLTEYCLDMYSPRASHKAHVFAEALGTTVGKAVELRDKLLEVASTTEAAIFGETDGYGQRYIVDFKLTTNIGIAHVRSGLEYFAQRNCSATYNLLCAEKEMECRRNKLICSTR